MTRTISGDGNGMLPIILSCLIRASANQHLKRSSSMLGGAEFTQRGSTGTGALGFVFREEPDAGGNLGIGEELAGQGDHALDEIRLDQGAADVALTAGIRTHRAIGEQ